jgi:hypothetical protein
MASAPNALAPNIDNLGADIVVGFIARLFG